MSTTLLSIISGITGMFGWGLYDLLGGVFAKQIGPYKSFFWSQLAGLVSILLLGFLIASSMDVPSGVMLLFPVAALLYSAGYLFFFKGFEIGNMSIVAAAMNLWAVFTMLFAFTFMGQRLPPPKKTVGVLFHCIRGYDRTGIIAFLVLALADVSVKDITADYELSVDSVRDQLLAERNTTAYEVLLKTLEGINLENYLLEGGLTQLDISALRTRFLEPIN